MITFRVTYDVVTEESAEHGDFAESGFYSRGGWKHSDSSEWTLRDIVREFRARCEDSGRWFSTANDEIDYHTGEQTQYSIHPHDGITAASYKRLARILCY
jgi:hypothetical protein